MIRMISPILLMIDEGLKLWGSILHYIFINHTIRPGHAGPPYPLQETPPAGSVPSEGNSLHRITSPLSTSPSLATTLNTD